MRRTLPLSRQAGFSLIELAIVLVIVGLLVGGGIAALTATTEQARRSEAKRQLEHVREALYGFVMSNGRLPCPDINGDGRGDPQAGGGSVCDDAGGALPWVDLGLGRRDPWGYPLYYHVTLDFADPDADAVSPAFDLDADDSDTDIEVHDENGKIADTPAVILSFGPQGGQVWTDSGFDCPTAGTAGFSADESDNCESSGAGEPRFMAIDYRPPDADDGRFDDVVAWLPLPILQSRMVDAGRLP